jgi:tetratricopeptide (TPR) repeat protein
MLTGDAPFDGPTPQAILVRKLSDETPSLRTRRRTVPPDVERVVSKAMAPLAADRYATIRELETALSAPDAATARRPPRRARPRSRVLLGAGIALLAIAAAWWIFGRGTPAEAAAPYALAVLPPENLSGEEEHFVAGQHQALIDQIASIHGFRVISRRSMLRFADTGLTVPEIAAELGVRGVVAMSLDRHGDSLRVRVELVQGEPEEALLWSGSFEGTIAGLYGMYREAARAVAAGADIELSPAEESLLGSERPVDPVTYEAYLMGMHLVQKGTPEAIEEGLAYLRDATDRSPTDALAWAGLAIGYSAVGHGPFPTDDAWTMARAAAERAVRLDSTLAEAWSALADVRFYADWDWEGAEAAFRRANELNPSIPMNHFHYAWLMLVLDRYEEAILEHEIARRLDPFTPFQSALLGWAYLYGGDTERAKEQAGRTLELNPDAAFGLFVLGSALQVEGDDEAAIATHERMVALYPWLRWLLGVTYARAGRAEEARRIAREVETNGPNALDAMGLAVLYGALGDVDASHRWATREPNHAWLPALPLDPIVGVPREVWSDPRFEDLMARLDLPWWEG